MDDTTQQNAAPLVEARQTAAWSLLFDEYHTALLNSPWGSVSTPALESDERPLAELVYEVLQAESQMESTATLLSMLKAIAEAVERRAGASHDVIDRLAADLATWQVTLMVTKGRL